MSDKSLVVLSKIHKYAREAVLYADGLEYEAFIVDGKSMSAIAFVLGQIGELVKNVSEKTQSKAPGIDWRGIRGLRNRIVHDYENIDMKMLWDVIKTDLPELIAQIENHLNIEMNIPPDSN